jgi:hypothetical protein
MRDQNEEPLNSENIEREKQRQVASFVKLRTEICMPLTNLTKFSQGDLIDVS